MGIGFSNSIDVVHLGVIVNIFRLSSIALGGYLRPIFNILHSVRLNIEFAANTTQ